MTLCQAGYLVSLLLLQALLLYALWFCSYVMSKAGWSTISVRSPVVNAGGMSIQITAGHVAGSTITPSISYLQRQRLSDARHV